jgi:uncharacterized protein YbjT (DUF2867 family)
MQNESILVTGATGYVGARLVPRLLENGHRVRATSRSIAKLKSRPWSNHANLEIVACDVLNLEALTKVTIGCTAAYYLVHSMNSQQSDFAEADRQAANNMVKAAEAAKLERIIYLGGLGQLSADLSKHLRSRAEVATILKGGSVPVTELRAAMIIGSGSASFEILRYLVDRLPFMITPKWVRTPSQPIAIRNVLNYLIACVDNKDVLGQTLDIGGPEILTYQVIMDIYAEEAGLRKRLVVPVPFFTPRLSSYWIHLVTPIPSYIGRPLAEGLRNPAICQDSRITSLIPQDLLDCRTAIKLAIEKTQHHQVESHWTDAGIMPPEEWSTATDPSWAGGTSYEDKRSIEIGCTPSEVWQSLSHLGGQTGWYYGNWLWKLRGLIDKCFGGVGLQRGRRNQSELLPGDALDFWRIAAVETDKRLLLIAEMKLPGQALLEFTIKSLDGETVKLTQSARFLPSGLTGILYWFFISPLHDLVFNGMLLGIARSSKSSVKIGKIKKGEPKR